MSKGRDSRKQLEVDVMLERAREEAVVREYYKTHKLAKSYQAVYPGVSASVASRKCQEILERDCNIAYMQDLIDWNAEKGFASLERAKSFLTEVMEGKIKDQFGLDASLADRIKAAEDIIRCEGGFKDKTEVNMNVNVADMLKAARERALNRQIPQKGSSSSEIIDVTPVGDT